jgi:hypothetical protein
MNGTAVPFRMETISTDMSRSVRTDGVLRLEADALVVEFRETQTSLMTLREKIGAVNEVRIPLEHIESMELRRLWFGRGRLHVRTRTMTVLANVPGTSGNEVRLHVRRVDRDRARELCISTSLALSGRELRQLGEKADG